MLLSSALHTLVGRISTNLIRSIASRLPGLPLAHHSDIQGSVTEGSKNVRHLAALSFYPMEKQTLKLNLLGPAAQGGRAVLWFLESLYLPPHTDANRAAPARAFESPGTPPIHKPAADLPYQTSGPSCGR